MATVTLRPAANGTYQNVPTQYPASDSHYDKVDEASADDATTYIRNDGVAVLLYDSFTVPATTRVAVITGVTVYVRFRCSKSTTSAHYIQLRVSATDYTSAVTAGAGGAWTNGDSGVAWANNPYTEAAWTWAEVSAMEIGIGLWNYDGVGGYADCTQVYVIVTYTPQAFSETVTDGLKVGDTPVGRLTARAAVVDGLKAGDTLVGRLTARATVTDGWKVGDAPATRLTARAVITDGLTLGDATAAAAASHQWLHYVKMHNRLLVLERSSKLGGVNV